MKKLILFTICVMVSIAANAQFVNGGSSSSRSSKSTGGIYSSGEGPHFQAVFGTSVTFCGVGAGPSLDIELGSRLRDFIFVGGGTGVHTVFTKNDFLISLPIYANSKVFLPIKENLKPFVNYSAGLNLFWLPVDYSNTFVGFYTNASLGIELGRHQISAGYEYLGLHSGFFKYALSF